MSTRGPRNRNNNNNQQSRSSGTRGNNADKQPQQTNLAAPASVTAVDATVPPRQRRKPQLLSRVDAMTTNTASSAPPQVSVIDPAADHTDQLPPGLSMPPGLQGAVLALTNDEQTMAVVPTAPSPVKSTTKSARLHYVPLFKKGDSGTAVVMLPGRHRCDCETRKHKQLINNCTNCGRIVCAQEGSGPCMFCGELVCTNAEEAILSQNTKASRELRIKLKGAVRDSADIVDDTKNSNPFSKASDSLKLAIADRDRLVTYDKENTKRTRVIDDQSDYFSYAEESKFMTAEERCAARELYEAERAARHAPRSSQKIMLSLDISGGRSVADTSTSSTGSATDMLRQQIDAMTTNSKQAN